MKLFEGLKGSITFALLCIQNILFKLQAAVSFILDCVLKETIKDTRIFIIVLLIKNIYYEKKNVT